MSFVVINTDGGARGNPGPAAIGVVIQKDGVVVHELGKYLGDKLTNNWAEYEALVVALEETKKLGLQQFPVEIRMDSELIVKQMKGEYKVKDPNLKKQHAKVTILLTESFETWKFVHVRRGENAAADALVNLALDERANKSE
ncbi:MAG: hypothetical protein RIQ56_931 [Candidatus Parcubacteria bacterium]|jgi:ribonuclease HI